MSEIPADIETTAHNIVIDHILLKDDRQSEFDAVKLAIARAILAERESCAAHCEKIGFPDVAHDLRNLGK